ncbi:MAG: hypothetical protein HYT08_00455 [Candidatus Levybacteria bacterium]|nr:hypothetical protein [Candidatus Levybacteria bacterium]
MSEAEQSLYIIRKTDRKELLYAEHEKFRKVDAIEVKRSFVIAQYIRKHNVGNKRYLSELTHEQFQERLKRAKSFVSHLSEPKLDEVIAEEYKKRLKAYNAVDWYTGKVHANEVGVWKGAGGLPVPWTQGSLVDTAVQVLVAMQEDSDSVLVARAKRAIPRIRRNMDIIEKDPYLYPIILPGGTQGRGLKGRPYKGFLLMKGDIDDGCMRAIAFVSSGRNSFPAYIGIQRRTGSEDLVK